MGKQTLYLFIGYPGAGKTTVAQMIEECTGSVHLWVDLERQKRFGNTYDSDESQELYKELNNKAEQLLQAGKSVIYDTNFNYYQDRELLRTLAHKSGAQTKIIWLTTSRELARKRALAGIAKQNTRVFEMTLEDFERTAKKLEIPTAAEDIIKIDGSHVSRQMVRHKVCGL